MYSYCMACEFLVIFLCMESYLNVLAELLVTKPLPLSKISCNVITYIFLMIDITHSNYSILVKPHGNLMIHGTSKIILV